MPSHKGGSPVEEISENFAIPAATIQQVLDYASKSTHTRR
jgi:uncharacterized protein (DUF433 family)